MAAISQTIFLNTFSWKKNVVFWLKIPWSLSLRVQLTITSISLDNGLVLNRRQAIIWTNADPNHWRIYAALGGDALKKYVLPVAGFEDMEWIVTKNKSCNHLLCYDQNIATKPLFMSLVYMT